MTQLRVALVGDDRLLCEGLRRVLSDDRDIDVTTYGEGAPLATDPPAHDIIVIDSRMADALSVCAAFESRGTPALLVSAPDDDDWCADAMTAGARGVLTVTSPARDLLRAVREIAGGGMWASRRWLREGLRKVVAARASPGSHLDERLSRRERDVFRYAAIGISNKEIADRLSISEGTVKVHLTHIFRKLGVTGRSGLAAAYHGLPAFKYPRADGSRN